MDGVTGATIWCGWGVLAHNATEIVALSSTGDPHDPRRPARRTRHQQDQHRPVTQPGRTWQERWLASGADGAGEQWAAGPALWLRCRGAYSASRLELMTSSCSSWSAPMSSGSRWRGFLTGGKKRKLARNMICSRDPTGSRGCAGSAGTIPR